MVRLRLRSLVAACLLAGFAPSPASADTVEDQAIARALAGEGLEALKKADFKVAEDRFRRAEQLFPDPPTIILGLARALKGQKRFVAATEAYNRIVRRGKRAGDSAAFEKAVDDAVAEKEDIGKLIGTLTISVKGAEKPTVLLDGQPVNAATLGVRRPIDPGQHEIKAMSSGKLDARRVVVVPEAGTTVVDLELVNDPKATPVVPAAIAAAPVLPVAPPVGKEPPMPATPATQTPEVAASSSVLSSAWFWTSVGVAAAGAGVAFYGYSSASSIKDECAKTPARLRACSQEKGYESAAMLNTVGYGILGAGVVGAAVVAFWPTGTETPVKGLRWTPTVDSAGSLGLRIDY